MYPAPDPRVHRKSKGWVPLPELVVTDPADHEADIKRRLGEQDPHADWTAFLALAGIANEVTHSVLRWHMLSDLWQDKENEFGSPSAMHFEIMDYTTPSNKKKQRSQLPLQVCVALASSELTVVYCGRRMKRWVFRWKNGRPELVLSMRRIPHQNRSLATDKLVR